MDIALPLAEIETRFAYLRARNERLERRVLASMAKVGQRSPVLVGRLRGGPTLLDGHKRFAAAKSLRLENLVAHIVEVDEVDAVVLIAKAQESERLSAVEEGFILFALQTEHELSLAELAERFERDQSFVQRRIALVRDFPIAILDLVRSGALSPSVMRALFPVARQDPQGGESLARACAEAGLSSREAALLVRGFIDAKDHQCRARLLMDPRGFLLCDAQRRSRNHDPRFAPRELQLASLLRRLGEQARTLAVALRSPAIRPLEVGVRDLLRAQWAETWPEVQLLIQTATEVLS